MPHSAIKLFAALVAVASCAAADEVVLRSGSAITGQLAESAERSGDQIRLETAHGPVKIDRSDVTRLIDQSPAESEYRRRAPSVSDTAEAQLALAMWCRDQGLGEAMRRHLRRVVHHAPDHEEARALLGYQRVDGAWMTRDDVLTARGLVRFQGRYHTEQEIELLKRDEHVDGVLLQWRRLLSDLRDQLGHRDPEVATTALQQLESIHDPAATIELIAWLEDETDALTRRKLVALIGRIGGRAGLAAMADLALGDPDSELRAIAIEQLAADGRPGLAVPFVAALKSPSNPTVNLAADALSVLGSPAVIDPLIDALITTHRWKVGNDSGGDTYSVSPNAGTFGFGGGGPQIIEKQLQNPRVLAALVQLTGVNFLYDQPRWRAWLAAQQVQTPPLRRDA